MSADSLSLKEFGGDIRKTVRNDFFDVAAGYAEEKWDSFFKAIKVSIQAFQLTGVIAEDNKTANSLRDHAGIVKLSAGPIDLACNLNALRHKTAEWIQNPDRWAFFDILRKINGLVGPITDTAELLTKVILYIPKESIKLLLGINGVALTIGSVWNSADTINKIYKWYHPEKGVQSQPKKLAESLLNLINAVTYVALGVLTVLAQFYMFVFSAMVWTPLSAICVATSIGAYYCKNIGEEKKIH